MSARCLLAFFVMNVSFAALGANSYENMNEKQLFDIVILNAQKNKTKEALAVLAVLQSRNKQASTRPGVDAKRDAERTDLFTMTKARLLFQLGNLDASDKTYAAIAKSSDYWLEALEERAHISGREGKFAKALEQLQSVMAAPFDSVVGPEPYFVAALTSLRICDYSAIFKVNENFKKRFVPRLERMKKLISSDVLQDKIISELISKLSKNQYISFEIVGSQAKDLPRGLHRDNALRQLSIKSPGILRDRAIAERIQKLAMREVEEIEDVVSKLHVVEAEAIQNVYLGEATSGERQIQVSANSFGNNLKNSQTRDVLNFPKNDEIWLDELTHYSVEIEKCASTSLQSQRAISKKRENL